MITIACWSVSKFCALFNFFRRLCNCFRRLCNCFRWFCNNRWINCFRWFCNNRWINCFRRLCNCFRFVSFPGHTFWKLNRFSIYIYSVNTSRIPFRTTFSVALPSLNRTSSTSSLAFATTSFPPKYSRLSHHQWKTSSYITFMKVCWDNTVWCSFTCFRKCINLI